MSKENKEITQTLLAAVETISNFIWLRLISAHSKSDVCQSSSDIVQINPNGTNICVLGFDI